MKETYIPRKFRKDALELIAQVNKVIEKYKKENMNLTLRQLYYQFVANNLFPDERRWSMINGKWKRDPKGTKNAGPNYSWIGSMVSAGRMAGLIDWSAIIDRTRSLKTWSSWDSPGQIIRSAHAGYSLDKWANQRCRVEVWIEKEALVGVIDKICRKLDVSYFACRGYVSQSAMWSAARSMKWTQEEGKECVIIHLGDHDPSGIDMTRDIDERQSLFHGADKLVAPTVERIALNMNQIEQYNPPPDPTKVTDTRAKDYIKKYGDKSWELDALEPTVLRDLIENAVLKYRDEDLYQETLVLQAEHKAVLKNLAENWRSM